MTLPFRTLWVGALLISALVPGNGAAQGNPAAATAGTAASPQPELVVLVHGLGRTRFSMRPLERELERAGYRVLNWGYSSVSPSIAEIGASLAATVDSAVAAGPDRPVHFVGHSLGNIVVRWVLAHDPPEGVGRIVMLAPPNQGSRMADRFSRWLGWLLKPLPELRTGEGSTVRSLPGDLRGVEFGIVAGERDGKVRLPETELRGAAGRVVVPAGHTFLMGREDVQGHVLRFLRTGRFGETNGTQFQVPSTK